MNKTMNTKNTLITTTQSTASVPISKRTSSSTRADWLVPTALIALTVIPFLGGAIRLVGLASGAEITPENARFVAVPLPVVIHIINALLFCILGAFQFAPGFRRRRPRWHRIAGRLLVPCGLAAGLSGLWMALFYPHVQGELLYGFRMLFGSAMVLSIALGLAAILRRDIARHRAWMIRGYAIGQGAGTQALIGLPVFLILGQSSELNNALMLGACWVVNLAVAEWIIRRNRSRARQEHGAPRRAA
jgi:uncharacterized membrane protein